MATANGWMPSEVRKSVHARNRLATVLDVEPYNTRDQQGWLHIVDVEYLNNRRYPEAEVVPWEIEATAMGSTSLPSVGANNPDIPTDMFGNELQQKKKRRR